MKKTETSKQFRKKKLMWDNCNFLQKRNERVRQILRRKSITYDLSGVLSINSQNSKNESG